MVHSGRTLITMCVCMCVCAHTTELDPENEFLFWSAQSRGFLLVNQLRPGPR